MEFWQIIADVWENEIARVFSLAIAVVFVLSLLTYRIASMAAFSRLGSTLCTTLGVLGTFTGVSGANSGGPQARRHLSRSRRIDDAQSARCSL